MPHRRRTPSTSSQKTPSPRSEKPTMVHIHHPLHHTQSFQRRSHTSPIPSNTSLLDPFAGDKLGDLTGSDDMRMSSSPPNNRDRRMSKEWDASKVPPSRFQRREGSIYSTPNSRDGHVKGANRDKAYHDKLKEKVRRF